MPLSSVMKFTVLLSKRLIPGLVCLFVFTPCYRGGRSRAAVSQEDESEEEMETSQHSDEEGEEESQESSPKVKD